MRSTPFFIILIAILSISCGKLESNNKLTTFEIIRSVPIEENASNIISFFNSLAIIDNKIYFCDTGDGHLRVYDKQTGKHISTIESSTKYSDTVAARKPDLSKTQDKNYYFPDINEAFNHSTQVDMMFQPSLCTFEKVKVDGSNINVLAVTKSVITREDNYNRVIANYVSIIKFNKNLDYKEQTIFEPRTSAYPAGRTFLVTDKKKYVSVCNNIRQYMDEKYDSLPAISEYDLAGKFKKTTAYLDSNYEKTQYGYSLPYGAEMLEIDNKFVYAYPYSGDIHVGANSFPLSNLPFTNVAGFQELFKTNGEFAKKCGGDGVFKYLPILIRNLYKKENNILAVVFQNKTETTKESKFYIQEYTISGDLLNQTEVITTSDKGDLQFIHYEEQEDKFYLFRKSKEKGWTMEVAQWH